LLLHVGASQQSRAREIVLPIIYWPPSVVHETIRRQSNQPHLNVVMHAHVLLQLRMLECNVGRGRHILHETDMRAASLLLYTTAIVIMYIQTVYHTERQYDQVHPLDSRQKQSQPAGQVEYLENHSIMCLEWPPWPQLRQNVELPVDTSRKQKVTAGIHV
jgi:hypothetical protein